MKSAIFFILISLTVVMSRPLWAANVNTAFGFNVGIAPSLGGNLHTRFHYEHFDGNQTGIDGMNRKMDGLDTDEIDRLTGLSGGLFMKYLFAEYYQVRIAVNYTVSLWGGEGVSLFNDGAEELVECDYYFQMYDVPLTLGISIPFWKDVKIVFSGGLAYARGRYLYQFTEEVSGDKYKGRFSGWSIPLVILIEGEYFITPQFAASASIVHYRGSSKMLRDARRGDAHVDQAMLDFSGFRYNFGITYYINPI